MFSTGDCVMNVGVPSAARKGQQIQIQCDVKNWTTKPIQSFTVKLVQTITWTLTSMARKKTKRFGRETTKNDL